jgi:hypothetical protein
MDEKTNNNDNKKIDEKTNNNDNKKIDEKWCTKHYRRLKIV